MSRGASNECPICGTPDATQDPVAERVRFSCPRCGEYEASREFVEDMEYTPGSDFGEKGSAKRMAMSAVLRKRSDKSQVKGGQKALLISPFDGSQPNGLRDELKAAVNMSFEEKTDNLLMALGKASEHGNQIVVVNASEQDYLAWQARAYALNDNEFKTIVEDLIIKNLVVVVKSESALSQLFCLRLTGTGRERAEAKKPGKVGF